MSLGRGYVFIRPIADREESSENLFEKKKCLAWSIIEERDVNICIKMPEVI